MTARYAIYAVPGVPDVDGAIAGEVRSLAESWIAKTVTARRYGYHATLKAPFRIAAGSTLDDDLLPALSSFAATRRPVIVPAFRVASIGGFWAITPGAPAPELHALADEIVADFDRFRGPATEDELARRRPEQLGDRRRELLLEWGYPYVFDEFRFHITLTDELAGDEFAAAGGELAAAFAPYAGVDLPVSTLALFVEPSPGAPFTVHSLHPLGAATPQEE